LPLPALWDVVSFLYIWLVSLKLSYYLHVGCIDWTVQSCHFISCLHIAKVPIDGLSQYWNLFYVILYTRCYIYIYDQFHVRWYATWIETWHVQFKSDRDISVLYCVHSLYHVFCPNSNGIQTIPFWQIFANEFNGYLIILLD
jgi:hypothetical protein